MILLIKREREKTDSELYKTLITERYDKGLGNCGSIHFLSDNNGDRGFVGNYPHY